MWRTGVREPTPMPSFTWPRRKQRRGDCVLMDSRLLHRGTSNVSDRQKTSLASWSKESTCKLLPKHEDTSRRTRPHNFELRKAATLLGQITTQNFTWARDQSVRPKTDTSVQEASRTLSQPSIGNRSRGGREGDNRQARRKFKTSSRDGTPMQNQRGRQAKGAPVTTPSPRACSPSH